MTVNVTVTLTETTGDPLVGARVQAKLFVPDVKTDFSVPESFEVEGVTDSSGECVLAVWPNSSNTDVTTYYRFRAWHPTTKTKKLDVCAYVDIAANLDDISYSCSASSSPQFGEWAALANHLADENAHNMGPYIVGSFLSVIVSGAMVAHLTVPSAITIAAGASGSYAKAVTAATAETVLSMKKNGVEFGTITFAAAGTSGTIAVASATSFAAGDEFQVYGPNPGDATLAGGSFSIKGAWA